MHLCTYLKLAVLRLEIVGHNNSTLPLLLHQVLSPEFCTPLLSPFTPSSVVLDTTASDRGKLHEFPADLIWNYLRISHVCDYCLQFLMGDKLSRLARLFNMNNVDLQSFERVCSLLHQMYKVTFMIWFLIISGHSKSLRAFLV
jgi:hypothetical protein